MSRFVIFLATIARALCRPFFPIKVYGPNKLEKKKTLLIGNHISGWDPVVFQMWCKPWISFVYKAEFRKSAFLRWAFDGLDFIPVKRGEVDLSSTRAVMRHLKDEKIVGLFPEGTRNPSRGCLQPFHTGVAMFALKMHAPIRPFYIWDKTKALHKNRIMVGEEFTLEQFYDKPVTKELLDEATEVVRSKVDELRIKLDTMLAEKGEKRRKLSKKEIAKLERYNQRQKTLAKELAKNQSDENKPNSEVPDREKTE